MAAAGAGRFKGETLSRRDKLMQSIDHNPASRHIGTFGSQRREPARDFVGIYEGIDIQR